MTSRSWWAIGALALLAPVLAFADSDRALSVDDVLRLHFAGISEEIIISEIIVTESIFVLSVDEILRLKEAGVSERLIQFVVDTGRAPDGRTESSQDDAEVDFYEDDLYYEESEDTIWVNEIQEVESTTTYRVSLNYSYPSWYYDCYWWDYWYYDFHYYPYQTSYVGYLGAWYPAWYGARWCWASPYWGYGAWYSHRHGHHGYNGYYAYNGYGYNGYDSYYPHHDYAGYRGGDHGLSDVKYKGGSAGRGGLPLYADVGLKVPDGGRLPIRHVKVSDPVRDGGTKKPGGGRLLVSDRPDRPDDVRKPTHVGVSPDRGGDDRKDVKSPGGVRHLEDRDPVRVRTPTRTVRTIADGGRPVKVKTLPTPSRSSEEPPRKDSEPPSRPPTRTVEVPESDTVKPSPTPQSPTRSVKPAPSTPSKPKVSSPPPRRPAPSAPPKVSSRPTRAPTKSPPSRGAPAPTRPKPRGKR